MVQASTLSAAPAPARPLPARRSAVAGLGVVGGSLMIGGSLLPWLSVYAGLDTIRGVNGTNGRVLLGAGVLAVALALADTWRPGTRIRSALAAIGFLASGFAAWVVAQLLGSYQQLGRDTFLVPSLGAGSFVALAGGLCVLATVLVPSTSGTATGPLPASSMRSSMAGDARNVLTGGAVAFLLSAAMIHLAVVGPHLAESTLYAAFFVAAAAAQIAGALALTVRPYHRLLLALALGNAVIIVVWALSRTTGLPVGPTPGAPESVSLPDVLASMSEAVVVTLAAVLAWRSRKAWTAPQWVVRAGMAAAALLAAVTTVVAVVGVQAGGG